MTLPSSAGPNSGGSGSGSKDGSKEHKFFLKTPLNSNSRNCERLRTRRDRFFRHIFRRKPCCAYFTVQIVLTVFLLGAATFLFFANRHIIDGKLHLQKQDELFEGMKDAATLLHCEFEETNEFHMEECKMHCGEAAVFYRISKLTEESKKDSTCFDRIESYRCHEMNYCAMPDSYAGRDDRGNSVCLGKGYAAMINDLISPAPRVYFPKLNLSSLPLGSLTLGNQILGMCPRCQVATHWRKESKLMRCTRRIVTLDDGFPTEFEKCNFLDMNSCD